MEPQAPDASDIQGFIKHASRITDPRDNRGKKHDLPFVLCGVILAILAGRPKVSGIQRYIRHKISWLCEITGKPDQPVISRAHLPRLLAGVDWNSLNEVIEKFFGIRLSETEQKSWLAIDGKTLRGTVSATDSQGQRLLLATTHGSRSPLAQRPMTGPKKSEITEARDLLAKTGLDQQKVTLDALHCNPKTTAQIEQAGGVYLIQVKENQAQLQTQLRGLEESQSPCGQTEDVEKAHGRLSIRKGRLFSLAETQFASRWNESGLASLMIMTRQTTELKTDKTTTEVSFYVSNQSCETNPQPVAVEHSTAIREHWGVESDNWIRDVTFQEDHIKTKDGNLGQVLGGLRTLAMALLRNGAVVNFQATLEKFADCPKYFQGFLHQVNFL